MHEMYAWSPLASTGYRCIIFWKVPAGLHLPTPKYLKAIRGKKTDKKDAKWIADLFKHDLVAASFMPPLRIRQLRDLMRYRFKLTAFASSEKNRV